MKQMNPGASLDSPANNTGIHNTKEHKGTKTFALLYYGDSEIASLLSDKASLCLLLLFLEQNSEKYQYHKGIGCEYIPRGTPSAYHICHIGCR